VAVYNTSKRIFRTSARRSGISEVTNILLIFPQATGKTLRAQNLRRMLDVPVAIVEATNLTEGASRGRK